MLETRYRNNEEKENKKTDMLKIRNILNILFMLGAIIGIALYYLSDHNTGIIVILGAMVFKIIESAIRFFQ